MSAPTPQAPTPDPTSASGPEETPRPSRLARAKSAYDLVSDVITPQTLFILLAAAIIAVTGVFGGWNNVATAEKSLPSIEPSATTTASPFQLSLSKGAWFSSAESIGLYPLEGTRYVMVAVKVTNLTDEPVPADVLEKALTPDLEGRMTLPGPQQYPEDPRVLKMSDAKTVLMLQPGLPYEVAVVWRQQSSAPPPTSLQIELNGHTFRLSSIDGTEAWRDPTAAEVVTVAIKEAKQ